MSDPDTALEAAQFQVKDEHVLGLLGPSSTSATQLVKVVAAFGSKPQLATGAAGVTMSRSGSNDFFFRNTPSDYWQVRALLDVCRASQWSRLVVLGDFTSESVSTLLEQLQTFAPTQGVSVVAMLVDVASPSEIDSALAQLLETKTKVVAVAADLDSGGVQAILDRAARNPYLVSAEYVWIEALPHLSLLNEVKLASTPSGPVQLTNRLALQLADLDYNAFLLKWASPNANTSALLNAHNLVMPTSPDGSLVLPDVYALCTYDAVWAMARALRKVLWQNPGMDPADTGPAVAQALGSMQSDGPLTGTYVFTQGKHDRESPLALLQLLPADENANFQNWTQRAIWAGPTTGFIATKAVLLLSQAHTDVVWSREEGVGRPEYNWAPFDRFCSASDVYSIISPCKPTGLRYVAYGWNESRPCRANHPLAYPLPPSIRFPCDTFASNSYGAYAGYALTAVLVLMIANQLRLLWSVRKLNIFWKLNPYLVIMVDVAAMFGIIFSLVNANEVTDRKCFLRPALFLITYCLGQGSLMSMGYQQQLNMRRGFTYVQRKHILWGYAAGSVIVLLFGMFWAVLAVPQKAEQTLTLAGGATLVVSYCFNGLNSFFPFLIFLCLFVINFMGLVLACRLRQDTRPFSSSRYIARCLLVVPVTALVAGFLTYMSTGTSSSYVLLTFQNLGCLGVFIAVIAELTRYELNYVAHMEKGDVHMHEVEGTNAILDSPIWSAFMLKFMQSRHMAESMEFLIALKICEAEHENVEFSKAALQIYRQYIEVDAPKEINMSSSLRDAIDIHIQKYVEKKEHLPRNLYKDIHKEMVIVVHSNAFRAFLQSEFSTTASSVLDWISVYDTFDAQVQCAIVSDLALRGVALPHPLMERKLLLNADGSAIGSKQELSNGHGSNGSKHELSGGSKSELLILNGSGRNLDRSSGSLSHLERNLSPPSFSTTRHTSTSKLDEKLSSSTDTFQDYPSAPPTSIEGFSPRRSHFVGFSAKETRLSFNANKEDEVDSSTRGTAGSPTSTNNPSVDMRPFLEATTTPQASVTSIPRSLSFPLPALASSSTLTSLPPPLSPVPANDESSDNSVQQPFLLDDASYSPPTAASRKIGSSPSAGRRISVPGATSFHGGNQTPKNGPMVRTSSGGSKAFSITGGVGGVLRYSQPQLSPRVHPLKQSPTADSHRASGGVIEMESNSGDEDGVVHISRSRSNSRKNSQNTMLGGQPSLSASSSNLYTVSVGNHRRNRSNDMAARREERTQSNESNREERKQSTESTHSSQSPPASPGVDEGRFVI
eukprot:gb/GEZN01000382.1/.p1 GENE.gb/GEZN01000382.1/~~gb/GEZN01000382.1/.p1  ORF type:complete len:1389 (-),score=192.84 gb/GEZN01000382.1/:511-4362(-)